MASAGIGVREIVDLHRAVDLKGRGDCYIPSRVVTIQLLVYSHL